MPSSLRTSVAPALAALLLAWGAAPAAAAPRSAEAAEDAAARATSEPARIIERIAVTFDDEEGTLTTSTKLGAEPLTPGATPAALGVWAGTTAADGSCGFPLAMTVVTFNPGLPAVTAFAESSSDSWTTGTTSAVAEGTAVNTHVQGPSLRGEPLDCIGGQLQHATTQATLSRTASAALPLPPPPPPPSPPPASAPPPAPVPAPGLAVGVSGLPRAVPTGRWLKASVTVANPGSAVATGVRLTAKGGRGVQVRAPKLKRGTTLAPGAEQRTTVRVKLKRGSAMRELRLSATGDGGLRAQATADIAPQQALPKAAGSKGSLAGRWFFGTRVGTNQAWDNTVVRFASERWAFVGPPADGTMPRCKSRTELLDDDGDATGYGCRPVRVGKGGAITVGELKGSWRKGKLVLDGLKMDELVAPRGGTRFALQLEHRGASGIGMCTMVIGCSSWHYTLELRRNGGFVRTTSSLFTAGDGVATAFIGVGSYPPDEYGVYDILPGGRIELRFADGTVKRLAFGAKPGPRGVPAPERGLLLGEDWHYPPDAD